MHPEQSTRVTFGQSGSSFKFVQSFTITDVAPLTSMWSILPLTTFLFLMTIFILILM
jgi:hypothetical protein